MIDIRNKVLTTLTLSLEEKFPDIVVQSPYEATSPKFPCVTFEEISNSTDVNSLDSAGEFASNISYEINIFTFGNKSQTNCLKIRNEIDNVMNTQLGMLRTSSSKVVNYADTSVFRWVLRYSCTVDKHNTIFRG